MDATGEVAYMYKKIKNRIYEKPTGYGKCILILRLPSGDRSLGTLNRSRRIFETTRKPAHVIKSIPGGGIGINADILNMEDFDTIRIKYGDKILSTLREFWLKHGQVVRYGSAGYETQILLPISEFGLDKAIKWLEGVRSQIDIFGGQDNEK